MGFRTISYGPRGSATLIREQLDRLLACEWMIRWENGTDQHDREFGIKEIKLTNEYVGVDRKNGAFIREIYMTEGFFDHLRQHAVPLNETAIRHIRDSATALDLYTWLAYRLPESIPSGPRRSAGNSSPCISATTVRTSASSARRYGTRGNAKFRRSIRRRVQTSIPPSSGFMPLPPHSSRSSFAGAHLQLASDDKGTASRAYRADG